MPWVRGHHRHPRQRRYRSSGTSGGGVGVLVLVGLAAIAILIKATTEMIAAGVPLVIAYKGEILFVGIIAVLVPTAISVRRWKKRRALQEYEVRARAFVAAPMAKVIEADALAAMAGQLGPRPPSLVLGLEALYREDVAKAIEDRLIDKRERDRLDLLGRALCLSQACIQQTELEAFLEVYTNSIADNTLTASEEAILTALQSTLRIPTNLIQNEITRLNKLRASREDLLAQLTAARGILKGELPSIAPPISLRRGETCHFTAHFLEKKLRVVDSYTLGGIRFSDKDLVEQRSGELYVTSSRLLLVSGGTTTIALTKMIDIKVDTETEILSVVVDGRKSAYYLVVLQPFVLAAFLHRAKEAA